MTHHTKILRDAFHTYRACPTVRNHEALLDAIGAALAADASEDAPDHGETVLRVQKALGITDTGWVSPDVVLHYLGKAILARPAPVADAPAPVSGERIMQLIEEAQKLSSISTAGAIPLTPIQVAFIVGKAVRATAAPATPTPHVCLSRAVECGPSSLEWCATCPAWQDQAADEVKPSLWGAWRKSLKHWHASGEFEYINRVYGKDPGFEVIELVPERARPEPVEPRFTVHAAPILDRPAPNPCGGCGNAIPDERCIGCGHIFLAPVEKAKLAEDEHAAYVVWVNSHHEAAREHLTAWNGWQGRGQQAGAVDGGVEGRLDTPASATQGGGHADRT